jgi:hypothetical protein
MPREELPLEEIIRLARKTQDEDLLEIYSPDSRKCEECGKERKISKGVPVIPKSFCTDECLKTTVKDLTWNKPAFIERIAAAFAKENSLPNGQTIHFLNDEYRNNNLLFWDAQNQRIVHPFTEADDYGSVPPIFPVGDGYFNPGDWIDEVEHNAIVFPSITLIREMKEFVKMHPTVRKMIVEINGADYDVMYDPKQMAGKWDYPIINVEPAVTSWGQRNFKGNDRLHVSPGLPEWRDSIVEEKIANLEAANAKANVNAKNAALLGLAAKYANSPEGNNIVNSLINKAKGPNGGRKTKRNKRRNTSRRNRRNSV